jgi:tetratricopeptide (TPR) repeat protein
MIGLILTGMPLFMNARMPTLKVRGEEKSQRSAVSLQRMDIEVEIQGNVAVTTMTLVFHNSGRRILEGELTFPMPEDASVSRYAIDINGRLREAVPVPKEKATEVFESVEHRRVDPGLLERIEGNQFRTRIYPLPPNGERTVLIAYEETLPFHNPQAMQYCLSLDCPAAIPRFSLHTKVHPASQPPQLTGQPDPQFTFRLDEHSRVYEASMQKKDFRPSRPLTVLLPAETGVPQVLLQSNRDGSRYFLINAGLSNTNERPKAWERRIGILWDQSLSGLHRDHSAELELLDLLIRQEQNLTVELAFFHIRFTEARRFIIRNGQWDELKACLQHVVYDGGTDFSQIQTHGFTAEEYLLFSDGLSTFGKQALATGQPVHCIASSARTDYSALKAICHQTGGRFVNLLDASPADAFRRMNNSQLQFLGIAEKASVSEVYPSRPVEVDGALSVAGILHGEPKTVTLLFGRNGKTELRQTVKLDYTAAGAKIHRLWAQKKIAEMDIQYDLNRKTVEELGREFGIVTRHTSLLVLENMEDYVRYDITPPAELLPEYHALLKNRRVQKEQRTADWLERAVASTKELKDWWMTDFHTKRKYPQPVDEGSIVEEESLLRFSRNESASAPPRRMEERVMMAAALPVDLEMAYERRASVTVAQREAPIPDRASNSISPTGRPNTVDRSTPVAAHIYLPKLRSDHAYMTALTASTDLYATYLLLRDSYLDTPSFYFDVSACFYEREQRDTALLILSNLADLEAENASLFKTLAYRLREKGDHIHQLFITQKIRQWRPMDPQSHRDYALALQDNGRYQEALDVLYSILTASYAPEAALRDLGIEETLVCEINNLVARHGKKLDTSHMDSRLLLHLPVDIRIVINWNRPDTDIDLWVIDPNGEACYYSNNRTRIGGRLSNDFTQGYGPEQFLLRKAINGTYQVKTNFFGERQLTLTGPTAIMAEVYLYYSDGRQERQVITFLNNKEASNENHILIGEFIFANK